MSNLLMFSRDMIVIFVQFTNVYYGAFYVGSGISETVRLYESFSVDFIMCVYIRSKSGKSSEELAGSQTLTTNKQTPVDMHFPM